MGKPITMPQEGIDQLIKDAYNMGEPYQWTREASYAALEAGTAPIPLGIGKRSSTRRIVKDDGTGMTQEGIERFLSIFNSERSDA